MRADTRDPHASRRGFNRMDSRHHLRMIACTTAVVVAVLFGVRHAAAQVQGFGGAQSESKPAAGAERGEVRERDGERRGRRGRRGDGERRRNGENRGENRQPPSESKPATPPAAAASSGFGATNADADRAAGTRKWASDLVEKHDKNDNKMLDADEQADLSSSTRGADQNGDGVITIDEIVTHVSRKSGSTTSTTPSTGFGTQTNSATVSSHDADGEKAEGAVSQKIYGAKKGTGKSYRFQSTKARQPSWRFSGKDTNGDGQVSMSEYSRNWTDRTAAEFKRYDRDNDGMITPQEVR